MDTLTIINAQNTDGYSIQITFADGTDGQPKGWYGSLEEAIREAKERAEDGDAIVNGTENWSDEEFDEVASELR